MPTCSTSFSDGPVVIGPTTPTLGAAHVSAVEALAGMEAVAGWRGAPRPVHAAELLPERALLGDRRRSIALNDHLVAPLAAAGSSLADTLDAYLDCGGAVETCARKLFVHPNTVRYRLKRIAEVTGRDPTNPRDAYVLGSRQRWVDWHKAITNANHQSPPVTLFTNRANRTCNERRSSSDGGRRRAICGNPTNPRDKRSFPTTSRSVPLTVFS